jgi:hypothetical protein
MFDAHSETTRERVSCVGCRHLLTTWDKRFPYGCRLFGIQSSVHPSVEVRHATGEECVGREAR